MLLWRGKRRTCSFKKKPRDEWKHGGLGGAAPLGGRHLTSCQELDQSITNEKRQGKVVSGEREKERQKKKGANEGGRNQPEETKYLSGLLNSI